MFSKQAAGMMANDEALDGNDFELRAERAITDIMYWITIAAMR